MVPDSPGPMFADAPRVLQRGRRARGSMAPRMRGELKHAYLEPNRAPDDGAGRAPERGACAWWLRGSVAILSRSHGSSPLSAGEGGLHKSQLLVYIRVE